MGNISCHCGERFSNIISRKLWKHNHKISSQGIACDKADKEGESNITLVCETLPSKEIKAQEQRCQHLPWAISVLWARRMTCVDLFTDTWDFTGSMDFERQRGNWQCRKTVYFKGRAKVDKLENIFSQTLSGIKFNGRISLTNYWKIIEKKGNWLMLDFNVYTYDLLCIGDFGRLRNYSFMVTQMFNRIFKEFRITSRYPFFSQVNVLACSGTSGASRYHSDIAKSKNHITHNQSRKCHRNDIKKPVSQIAQVKLRLTLD